MECLIRALGAILGGVTGGTMMWKYGNPHRIFYAPSATNLEGLAAGAQNATLYHLPRRKGYTHFFTQEEIRSMMVGEEWSTKDTLALFDYSPFTYLPDTILGKNYVEAVPGTRKRMWRSK